MHNAAGQACCLELGDDRSEPRYRGGGCIWQTRFGFLLESVIPFPCTASVSCTQTHTSRTLLSINSQQLCPNPSNQEGPSMWKREEKGQGSARACLKTQFCPRPCRSKWMHAGQAGAARPSFGASLQRAEPRKNTWWLCAAVTLQEKSL